MFVQHRLLSFVIILTIAVYTHAWSMQSSNIEQFGLVLSLDNETYNTIFSDYTQKEGNTTLYVDLVGRWENADTQPPPLQVSLAISTWFHNQTTHTIELQGYSLEDNACQTAYVLEPSYKKNHYHCEVGHVLAFLLPPLDDGQVYYKDVAFAVGFQFIFPLDRAFELFNYTITTTHSSIVKRRDGDSDSIATAAFWDLNTTRYYYRRAEYQHFANASRPAVFFVEAPRLPPITPPPPFTSPTKDNWIAVPSSSDITKDTALLFIAIAAVAIISLLALGITAYRLIKRRRHEAHAIEMTQISSNDSSLASGEIQVTYTNTTRWQRFKRTAAVKLDQCCHPRRHTRYTLVDATGNREEGEDCQ